MARTDNDTWGPHSGVGATATGCAASRALASRQRQPLIVDPYAEPLVAAVGIESLVRMARDNFDPAIDDATEAHALSRRMAARTKFFDDFLIDATTAGCQQVVILASGLDSRAYRLRWPERTTVFDVDQPQVIDFKTTTLAGLGVQPSADLRAVGVDLRDDWPTAVAQAGHDPNQRTAWIAEGLLNYLPADAQDRLLDNVTSMSVHGSWLAAEFMRALNPSEVRPASKSYQDGLDEDVAELIYLGDRNHAASYLGDKGWDTTVTDTPELLSRYGLEQVVDNGPFPLNDIVFITATR